MGNLSAYLNRPSPSFGTAESQIRQLMLNNGITPPTVIEMDGHIHRFAVGAKEWGDSAGWYVVYPSVVPAGAFGNWREGSAIKFQTSSDRALSSQDRARVQQDIANAIKKAELERQAAAQECACESQLIWQNCDYAQNSEYLTRKGVKPFNIKIAKGKLVVPVYNINGQMTSLQYIHADGTKQFCPGGIIKGCFHKIGNEPYIYMAEGFATAASICEATGKGCYIAFNAGNLKPVMKNLKDSGVDVSKITIVADNDASGTGEKKAIEACEATGCKMKLIPNIGMDANDYASDGNDLKEFLEGGNPWFTMADDLCAQPTPIKWLIKGWLQADGMSLLHAQPAAGKTFLVLEWLLSIANGMEWRECKVRKYPVAYLCGEGYRGVSARLALWKQEHGLASLGEFAISNSAVDVDTPIGMGYIRYELDRLPFKPKIVAIDTLNRFMSGDENSAQETRRFLNNLTELGRELDCHFLIVQHEGVAADAAGRARGSSAWRGAVDNEFSLVKAKDGTITLKQCKMKDSAILEPLYMRLEEHNITGWFDEDDAPVSSMILVESDPPVEETRQEKEALKEEDVQEVIQAYLAFGEETVNGLFLDKQKWHDYLMETKGLDGKKAWIELNPKQARHLVNRLLKADVIAETVKPGWVITDTWLNLRVKNEYDRQNLL